MIETDPPSAPPEAAGEQRRRAMRTALQTTVLEAAARRLSEAVAEYDAALERGATMPELRCFDQEVARAERDHARTRRRTLGRRPDRG